MSAAAAYHVAQMNWGLLRADWDDPLVAEAKQKLDLLTAQGASEDAYDFKYPSENRSRTEAV